MQPETLEILLLGVVALCASLTFGWLSAEDLRRIALFLLIWSAGSTLLVAAAATWVALVRSLRPRHPAPRAR